MPRGFAPDSSVIRTVWPLPSIDARWTFAPLVRLLEVQYRSCATGSMARPRRTEPPATIGVMLDSVGVARRIRAPLQDASAQYTLPDPSTATPSGRLPGSRPIPIMGKPVASVFTRDGVP